MLFSERYGYKKAKMLKPDEMPHSLKTKIWNTFYVFIFRKAEVFERNNPPTKLYAFTLHLWDLFFEKDLSMIIDAPPRIIIRKISRSFFSLKWFRIYDFIEFIFKYLPEDCFPDFIGTHEFQDMISDLFRIEKVPYQIVHGLIIPLLADEERSEIEKILNIPDTFTPVREHLNKALNLWADRQKPDYQNSIKESILAIESLVMIIEGEKGTLTKLIEKLNIHPQMKQGFKNLYNWTSDDSGIRHGESGESFPCDETEARYMLITSSAFINYIINIMEK